MKKGDRERFEIVGEMLAAAMNHLELGDMESASIMLRGAAVKSLTFSNLLIKREKKTAKAMKKNQN